MKTILCFGDSNTFGYVPGTGVAAAKKKNPWFSVQTIVVACVALFAILITLVVTAGGNSAKVGELEAKLKKQDQQISTLEDQLLDAEDAADLYQEKADFLDENIAFIVDNDDVYYHTYDCEKTQNTEYFKAFNTNMASGYGYKKCPLCH